MYLVSGGQTEDMGKDRIEEVRVSCDEGSIQLWLNDRSLSYLTINEALELRDELNQAIKKATGT